jgi:hypothetical protein
MYLYGGGFTVRNVTISDVSEHGVWTRCGKPDNSWAGDAVYRLANMHEATVCDVVVCCPGGHAFLIQGPNDSFFDRLKAKMPGESCFRFESGEDFSCAGAMLGTLHGYSPVCRNVREHTYLGVGVSAQHLYIDSPPQDGLVIDGSGCLIDQAQIVYHNERRDNPGWGAILRGSGNRITSLRYVADALAAGNMHGGALQSTGSRNRVQGYLYGGGSGISVKGVATELSKTSSFSGDEFGW